MKIRFLALLFCAIAVAPALAQTSPHWVIFNNKPAVAGPVKLVSDLALQNRQKLGLPLVQETDVPVNPAYVQALRDYGIPVKSTSKWLNAAFVTLTNEQKNALALLPFVKEVSPVTGQLIHMGTSDKIDPADYDQALMQVKAEVFAKANLTGAGVTIGVIDAGYYGAKETKELEHLFAENRIKGINDQVNPKKTNHFGEQETPLDFHGTTVLVNIAGYNKDLRQLSGLAPNASFYLARTDHGVKEWRGEEHHYVRALEWLDSLGVRLVNTSLGYATGFDDPAENYKPADINGKTSLITKAVQTAATEKGMLMVVAAGNEGAKENWRIISAPADAEAALTVGAIEFTSWTRANYSGRGPEALPYLKPDVVCYSATGTSFSAPVITGFAACLMQKKPEMKTTELYEIIRKSGHLYPYGNNLVGYGVPQAPVALRLLENPKEAPQAQRIEASGNTFTYKVLNTKQIATNGGILLYHKKDERNVIKQEKGTLGKKGRITVTRQNNAARTTLQAGLEVVEIVWKD